MTEIFDLSSSVVDQLAEQDPELSTFLGAPGRDHLWGDLSPAGFDKARAFWGRIITEAQACSVDGRDDEVAQAVLIAEAEHNLRSIDAGTHFSDLNNIASPWQGIRAIFDSMPDHTVEAWQNIAQRLRTIDQPLAGHQECLAAGMERNAVAAVRQVTVAIEQGRSAAGPDSGFNVLLARFDAASENESAINAEVRADVVDAIAAAKAAVGTATDWLENTYLPAAPEADGVGRDRYVASAEHFLGEPVDPEQLYAWGWTELERLTARMHELCASIDASVPTAEVIDRLHHDPSVGVEGADAFIAVMLERQQAALSELDGSHFDVPVQIREIEVKAAPPGGALAPYYSPPSEDFSRAGCVWYPIGERTFFPLYEEVTTAYHEGFPGHHLQVGWQAAMGEQLSRFHRLLVWHPGSGEGWALYAEHFMGELGYLEETAFEIGLVASQLFRSARIVIDTGWHCGFTIPTNQPFHPGEDWTFELVTEMLRTVAFAPADLADSEATRYAGWPGQAISYKVGERAILDLRKELSRSEDFDLKEFHAKLLSVGSIGLDLMRDLVRSA